MYPNNQMPPPNPTPPPYQQPQQPNPYSFITDGPAQGKQPKFRGPSGMRGRILLFAGGIILLMIIFAIVMSFLGRAGKAQTERYVELAKKQTEIIRISSLAEQKAKTLETKSYATTIRLAFTSEQAQIFNILEKNGISQKSISKQLSASKNTKTDELLKEAEENNRYDETYTELVKKEMNSYKTQLNATASGAGQESRAVLQNSYKQADILLGTNINS